MLEGLRRAGGDPPALRKRPDILGLEWLWSAFMDLNTCRISGMSLGPIPWTAIHTYTVAEGFDSFERRMTITVVMEMDRRFIQWHSEKAKSVSKKKVK